MLKWLQWLKGLMNARYSSSCSVYIKMENKWEHFIKTDNGVLLKMQYDGYTSQLYL